MKQPATRRISRHLRAIVDDVEQILHSLSEEASSRADRLGIRAGRQLHDARDRIQEMEVRTSRQLRRAGRETRGYVSGHRWQAVGGVAVLALAAMMLARRRR
ncbi:MAG: hypothetical protein M3Q42_13200 [Pseudomonadota bacterium]|nr:hypothetical protein [Pseudomonadota bacterium]